MAFTTAPLPADKEQGAFWLGHEELPVANDNFFDQYVSFDPVEPATSFDCGSFGEPPSPSILLDSLDGLASPSDGQDQPPAQRLVEAAVRPGLPVFSAQHARSVPVLYDDPPDLALGRGSISDSELLRLEGTSLRSPRGSNSTNSSPRLMPSAPLSPRKSRRFPDSIHAPVRRAAHRPSAPGQVRGAAPPPDIKTEPGYHAMLQQAQDMAGGLMSSLYGPIDCHDRPLSPPLTGELPAASQQPPGTQFVTGHLEDPFSEGYVALPPARAQAHEEDMPLYTPGFRNNIFRNASQPMDLAHPAFQPHKPKSTSSAEWPAESPVANDPRAPRAAGPDGPDGWADGADGVPAGGHPAHDPHDMAARTHQPKGPPYEGPRELADGLSGLMIHMPEPPLGMPTTPRRRAMAAYPPASVAASSPHRPRGLYTDRRPPPPRALASGARHHGAASLTSPRKPSALHHHASRPLLVRHRHREDETLASPAAAVAGRRSSSMPVRKQRSWSRREPRTPNLPPSATTPTTSSAACSPGLGGGGVGFVNLTPSDKNVLMHGVAPSGSSKTKARREKEALDRRRKLSEAAYKAVQAAGGDIERLRAEVSSL